MSFPRYPRYKNGDVEWLGALPEHWRAGQMRWLSRRYSGGTPDKTNLDYWQDGTIPWLNSGAVNDRLITQPSTYITADGFANSSAKWIPAGALVMALAGQGKTKGMVAQLAIPTTCNQSMAAIVPTSEICSRFLFWWLDSNYQNIRNMAGGDLRDGLNLELVGNIHCPLPLLPEQITIATFLDRETAKIDALVSEQQRLIELLKEKRQAVISHAVTHGLNANAPMKPSGSEWLGNVPAHWSVRRMKFISPHITVGIVVEPSKFYVPEGIPALRSLNVKPGSIAVNDLVFISPEGNELHAKSRLRKGDLVAVRSGQPGTTAVIPDELDGCNCIDLIIIRRPTEASEWFLSWFLASHVAAMQFAAGSGGAIQQHFNIGMAKDLLVASPGIDEQNEIVAYLDTETGRLDALVAEVQRSIELLRERRAALISAAVTGQVDLRGLADIETAAA